MVYVYVLYSTPLKKYYVGSTNDVQNRVDQHNAGRSNFTSRGIPWIHIVSFECNTRVEAVRLEFKIKKRGIERYLRDNNLY
jgi:putative endonuclease